MLKLRTVNQKERLVDPTHAPRKELYCWQTAPLGPAMRTKNLTGCSVDGSTGSVYHVLVGGAIFAIGFVVWKGTVDGLHEIEKGSGQAQRLLIGKVDAEVFAVDLFEFVERFLGKLHAFMISGGRVRAMGVMLPEGTLY